MNKKKTLKRIVIITLIMAVVVVGVVLVLSMLKKKNQDKREVLVVPVSSMCSDPNDWGMSDSSYSGYVSASMNQKVYINSDTKIEEVYVTEGQTVKAGDPILKYDVTAQQLQLDSKKAQVALANNRVTSLERDLKRLNETVPIEEMPKPEPEPAPTPEPKPEPVVPPTTEDKPATETPATETPATETPATETPATETPATETPTSETPTSETPTSETPTTETPATEAPATEAPATEAPATEAPATEAPTTEAPATEAPTTEAPSIPEMEDPDGMGMIYNTREELNQAIKDKENEIRDAKVSAALEEISYEIMLNQNQNPELYSNFDGVVTKIEDEETAITENKPYITISNSEGLTVVTYIGEYSLADIQIGDSYDMYCYDTGMSYTGTVSDVGNMPSEDYDSWGAAQSYYPVELSVMDAADLSQGMYLEVTKTIDYSVDEEENGDGEPSSFTIPIQFVKKDAGKRYVMKEENGKLVKVYVKTGKIYWGSEIEILGGLSQSDYIAFPYLADAVEGVKTRQGTIDEFWGY